MKKIVSFAVLAALIAPVANAAPKALTRTKNGGYQVTYDYNDKAKTGWYVGGRAELSLLNWKNKYSTEPEKGMGENTESYSETVFGGSLFAGRTFNYFWRAELEAGLIGQYSDKDMGYEFKLTVPYVMLNGYYDFANGLYVGAGLGLAVPKTELDDDAFVSGGRSKRAVSPMGALMAGWTHKLDYNLALDLRYRLSAFGGTKHTRTFAYGTEIDIYEDGVLVDTVDLSDVKFTNDIGLILDNSLSIGLRYEF